MPNDTLQSPETYSSYHYILIFIFMIPIAIIFPFYIHVFRMNQERDKATPVFPMINHFYKILKIVYIFMYAGFIANIGLALEAKSFVLWISVSVMFIVVFMLDLSAEVSHFLLSLLVIQRFIVYFFPTAERFVKFSSRSLWSIHVLFCLLMIIEVLCFVSSEMIYIGFNCFLMASALLYSSEHK